MGEPATPLPVTALAQLCELVTKAGLGTCKNHVARTSDTIRLAAIPLDLIGPLGTPNGMNEGRRFLGSRFNFTQSLVFINHKHGVKVLNISLTE